jgi:hypothetical protein
VPVLYLIFVGNVFIDIIENGITYCVLHYPAAYGAKYKTTSYVKNSAKATIKDAVLQ